MAHVDIPVAPHDQDDDPIWAEGLPIATTPVADLASTGSRPTDNFTPEESRPWWHWALLLLGAAALCAAILLAAGNLGRAGDVRAETAELEARLENVRARLDEADDATARDDEPGTLSPGLLRLTEIHAEVLEDVQEMMGATTELAAAITIGEAARVSALQERLRTLLVDTADLSTFVSEELAEFEQQTRSTAAGSPGSTNTGPAGAGGGPAPNSPFVDDRVVDDGPDIEPVDEPETSPEASR